MDPTRFMVLSVMFALSFAVNPLHLDQVSYTESVIQHFFRNQPGRSEIVFVNLQNVAVSNTTFDTLMGSPKLSAICRYVIDGTFKVDFDNLPHKPALLIVHAGEQLLDPKIVKKISTGLFVLDSNTKVLVLVDLDSLKYLGELHRILKTWSYNYVVFVGTTQSKVMRMNYRAAKLTIVNHYPDPQNLFKDAVKNMHGSPIVYTVSKFLQLEDRHWMEETARLLNTTSIRVTSPCKKTMSLVDCRMELYFANHIDISLDQFLVTASPPIFYRALYSVFPDSEVIMVPRARVLNIVELFVEPFTWQAWFFLVVILIVAEVIAWMVPDFTGNDPVLLLVCGLERNNLHRATSRERLVFLPLIVFFFLMSNAYESKVISSMTEKPSLPEIKTIQELIKSDFMIKVNLNRYPKIVNNTLLGFKVLNDSSAEINQMDGINAYITEDSLAQSAMELVNNYDFELDRPRYRVIPERLKMDVFSYSVAANSPLVEMFRFTQRTFFESGLLVKWKEQGYSQYSTFRRPFNLDLFVSDGNWLRFSDLLPAWIALGIGLLMGGVVFMGEKVFSKTRNKRQRDMQNKKNYVWE